MRASGSAAGGGSFNVPIVDKGSDKSCSGARSELKTETELLQNAMRAAASQIVAAVSPQTVKMDAALMDGDSKDNKLGNDLFLDGLPDQAIDIWTQVVESQGGAQARRAAYHNLGVAYESQGDLKTAFDYYSEAFNLKPTEERHRLALKRVQDGQSGRDLVKAYK